MGDLLNDGALLNLATEIRAEHEACRTTAETAASAKLREAA